MKIFTLNWKELYLQEEIYWFFFLFFFKKRRKQDCVQFSFLNSDVLNHFRITHLAFSSSRMVQADCHIWQLIQISQKTNIPLSHFFFSMKKYVFENSLKKIKRCFELFEILASQTLKLSQNVCHKNQRRVLNGHRFNGFIPCSCE